MAKQLNGEDIIVAFESLKDSEQITTFAAIKETMEKKEEERKELSASYLKVNGGMKQ